MESGVVEYLNEELGCCPMITMEVRFIPGQETLSVRMCNLPKSVWDIFLSEDLRRQFNLAFPPLVEEDKYPHIITLLVYPGEMNALASVIRGAINPGGFNG